MVLSSTVDAVARFQRDYNGTQPGDPVKAAAVIRVCVPFISSQIRLDLPEVKSRLWYFRCVIAPAIFRLTTNSSLKNSVCGLLKKTQRRGRALFVIVSVKRDR